MGTHSQALLRMVSKGGLLLFLSLGALIWLIRGDEVHQVMDVPREMQQASPVSTHLKSVVQDVVFRSEREAREKGNIGQKKKKPNKSGRTKQKEGKGIKQNKSGNTDKKGSKKGSSKTGKGKNNKNNKYTKKANYQKKTGN